MTTAKPTELATPEAEKFPRKAIPCQSGPSDDEKGRAYANLINSPELAAHRIVSMMQPKNLADEIDAPGMLEALRDQVAAVQRGDLAHAEAMLINQASALQALFVRLSERAMEQTRMPNLEGFMRLALRSQSQCRATLETLAAIKNPPTVFARQANIAHGPQQVNNGGVSAAVRAGASARGKNENEQTELLEVGNGERLDTGTTNAAGAGDQTLATVEPIHRAENR